MNGFARHIVIGSLAALGAAATAGCARPDAKSVERAAAGAPTVAVIAIGRGDVKQVVTVASEFRPFQEIEIHAKVAGFLKSIAVDVGDHVQAGQLLAVLEVPELQDEVRQDDASARRAAEEINRAEADLDRAESAHDVAHLGAAQAGERHEGSAEPRRAAGHRRGRRPRPRGRGPGRHRAGGARLEQRTARDRQGHIEQDADAVRLHAHHRAVCRRHHPPVRRHRAP